jgi:hypothetical protein
MKVSRFHLLCTEIDRQSGTVVNLRSEDLGLDENIADEADDGAHLPEVDEAQEEAIRIEEPSWNEATPDNQAVARKMNKWMEKTIGGAS